MRDSQPEPSQPHHASAGASASDGHHSWIDALADASSLWLARMRWRTAQHGSDDARVGWRQVEGAWIQRWRVRCGGDHDTQHGLSCVYPKVYAAVEDRIDDAAAR